MSVEIDLERAISEISARGARIVGLQMPEGLKARARELARQLEESTGCQTLILGDPCYGACDIKRPSGIDLLIHVGHAPIPDLRMGNAVVYLEARVDLKLHDILSDTSKIREKVGLIATAQHMEVLPLLRDALERTGRKVMIGVGDARLAAPGQILGCNISSALDVRDKVEQFIFLGSGYFHPLAVSIGTGLPVLCLDPYRGMVEDVQEARDKVMRQRYAAISKAMDARDWLVLLCEKPGQRRNDLARACRDALRKKGLKADIILLNEVRGESLLPYRAEAAVSTACPRLAMDDGPNYPIPLLTPWEMEMALGLRKMDDYRLDQIMAGDTPE